MLIRLGNSSDLRWAQDTVEMYHYLRHKVDPRARPMVYILEHNNNPWGLVMAGIPHATKCRGWWGYPGLPTQWQVVDLCRIWINPDLQTGGTMAHPGHVPGYVDRKGQWRPTVASWMVGEVLARIQQDRVSMWPPVFLEEPYHIRLVISYHDPAYHRGALYRQMKWQPMYTNESQPIPGSSGKFGWCWPLTEPDFTWQDLSIIRPRTIRMTL